MQNSLKTRKQAIFIVAIKKNQLALNQLCFSSDKPQHLAISATVTKCDTVLCKLGQTVSLTCQGQNRHRVTYKWIKDEKVIARQREMQINVESQNDFGLYKCQASNKAGSSTTTVRVVSQDDSERGLFTFCQFCFSFINFSS